MILLRIFRKRRRTEEEKASFNKSKYSLLDPCKDSCRKSCARKFTKEERQSINDNYWTLPFEQRRLWLDDHMTVKDVSTRKVVNDNYTRNHTVIYQLPLSSSKVTVCKNMFMRTLGMKADGMLNDFIKSKAKSKDNLAAVLSDNRGKAAPPNKKDKQSIRDHISSYNPQISHYRRESVH